MFFVFLKMKNDCHMSAQNLHYSKVRWYIPIPDSMCGSFRCGLNAMATFNAFYFCYKKFVGLGSSFSVLNFGSCPNLHVTYLKLRRK